MVEDDLPEDYDIIVLGTGICFIVTLYRAVIVQKKVPNYTVKLGCSVFHNVVEIMYLLKA